MQWIWDIEPVEFLSYDDDDATKVVLNLVEGTLQGRDVELFGESLYALVQVFQF